MGFFPPGRSPCRAGILFLSSAAALTLEDGWMVFVARIEDTQIDMNLDTLSPWVAPLPLSH